MKKWNSENEARDEIKSLVASYYEQFKKNDRPFVPGDRINYASRVFDEKEMMSLTDAALDFWLTTGRFSDEFEKEFAKWIGVKHVHQRLLRKSACFYGAYRSRAGRPQDKARR